ncbi:SDR family oxidoreductase [Dellaglioa sp. L3N]
MNYTVTGATGNLGTAITEQLMQRVATDEIRLAVHTLAKAAVFEKQGIETLAIDYFDQNSLLTAFDKTDVLIYVASKSHDSFSRVTELENVIKAAEKAHVGHFISMGFIADQIDNPFDLSAFYGYLPRRLASSNLNFTILRNALYADPLIPYLPELIERTNVIYPINEQALSFISLEDSAEAFATVATKPELQVNNKIYTLTQSQNYTMPQLAALLSEVSHHHIGYQPVTLTTFADMYNDGDEGHMLSSMYAGGALGLLSEVSNDFVTITGHAATDLTHFLNSKFH